MSAKWILFEESLPVPGHRTKRWTIYDKDGRDELGFIAWYSPWRCYSFYPFARTIYEKRCLRDIADFCDEQTQAHRAALKQAKAS